MPAADSEDARESKECSVTAFYLIRRDFMSLRIVYFSSGGMP